MIIDSSAIAISAGIQEHFLLEISGESLVLAALERCTSTSLAFDFG